MNNKPRFVGEKVRLGDVASIEKAPLPQNETVWLLNLDAIEKNTGRVLDKTIVPVSELGSSTVPFSSNSVLYSKLRPNLNKVVLPDEDGVATSEMLPLVSSSSVLDRRYLAAYLRSHSFVGYAVAATAGAKMPRVNRKTVLDATIFLPELREQEKRMDALDSIEASIDIARQQINQLDQLVKSRFVEMFGDPISNSKQLDTKPGSALFKIGNGKSKPASERYEVGIPAYGGNGISWYSKECLVDDPTIVIGRVGRHCGNTRLVNEPCWVTDNAMYIKRFLDDGLDLIYLDELMRLVGFNRYADKGDLWKITQQPFMDFAYPMPPLEDQRRFSSFVAQVDKPRLIAQQQIEKLQMLYDSLAQDYFA